MHLRNKNIFKPGTNVAVKFYGTGKIINLGPLSNKRSKWYDPSYDKDGRRCYDIVFADGTRVRNISEGLFEDVLL